MTEHPEEYSGAEPDQPLVDDLIDETRGPDEDRLGAGQQPSPPADDAGPPETPEPPD